ncbi:MAG TPA: hypothetical protein VFM80_04330 [Gracilimonas sp.]|uniref:hypothetical protein n=1 Tax=Gracilimonas sp. TaxID=1974203 RepID=UPI002D899BF6|nr:hypothetical protein [Gracilimonas sp.]
MKSTIIWLSAIVIGGLLGYGAIYFIDFNMYLAVGIGVLIGSSLGITINIHREREYDLSDEEGDGIIAEEPKKPKKVS